MVISPGRFVIMAPAHAQGLPAGGIVEGLARVADRTGRIAGLRDSPGAATGHFRYFCRFSADLLHAS
ncbi:hypothetical protein [Novosphingobium sp.]|uniref:hypothetical protein n=1 Tax=Novosphingobium sp. TaxID=1874826 RepID=UPI001D569097|nr:hypothetical protein [Novosphingobium sp.]MBX9662265.1 hypothetical protein [Novosphingobium sp.]